MIEAEASQIRLEGRTKLDTFLLSLYGISLHFYLSSTYTHRADEKTEKVEILYWSPPRDRVSLTVGILIEFQVDSQTQQQHERDEARSFVLPDVSGNSSGSADLVTVIGGIDD